MKLKLRDYKFNKKIITSCILIVALLCVGVGYSYLQTTLAIDGDVSFDACFSNNHRTTILGQTVTYYDDDKCSEFVSGSTGINFFQAPSDTNGKGIYLRAGTENDENPIYYYRGNVDNNHVLFGGYCWDIIRTTEQGGVKLIYDGEPNNGQCNNTGASTVVAQEQSFNITANPAMREGDIALADIGYMYGTRYEYAKLDHHEIDFVLSGTNYGRKDQYFSWVDSEYMYGSDVEYNNGVYTLIGETEKNAIANMAKRTKHYTCKSAETTCSTVYYAYSLYKNEYVYAIELTNGEKLENIINNSLENINDSKIKQVVDNWFKDSLISQLNKLEDAVWCNDRSMISGGYIKTSDIKGYGEYESTILAPYDRTAYLSRVPQLKDNFACKNQNDRFTVNDVTIGNGALTYPVGIVTSDETNIAGYAADSYLNCGHNFWTLSPSLVGYLGYKSYGYIVGNGSRFTFPMADVAGVRPSIVLKKGIVATSGNGTSTNPYVVN